uniref:Nucleoside-diphosphate-sugar epimerase (GalE, GALE) n=1 Tax=uncultured marine thaumarchaeote KM3_53_B02 TaxID=1456180 RepID=A0A075HCP6_9ARCH|nr:nucleoside-diphosphate-sugar epimerase (galE, GALE) [uncultured marine thaumarchaeote KM3_53_B02]
MHFAVTGGAGFIGNNIVKNLIKRGHNVCVIDNLNTGKLENLESVRNKVDFFKTDIRDFDKINQILTKMDGVFHQAALTVVQDSYTKKDEYYDVNVKGTRNIFESAKRNKLKVVFASSSSIYGDTKEIPIKENFQRNPINPYGDTKLQTEILAEEFSDYGVQIIGLRYFNVYGIGQNKAYAGVITKFLDKVRSNQQPIIFGDGQQIRDFVSVEDVAEANVMAMFSDIKNDFFNIGSGKKLSIKELAEMIIQISNLELEPKFENMREGDVRVSQADTSMAENMLKWKSKKELNKWLEDLFKMDGKIEN